MKKYIKLLTAFLFIFLTVISISSVNADALVITAHETQTMVSPATRNGMVAVTNVKVTSASTTAVKLSWKKVTCKGYEVKSGYTGRILATVIGSSTNTAKISGLSAGTKYCFIIRPFKYKSDGKTKLYGPEAKKYVYTKAKVTKVNRVITQTGKVTLYINKVKCLGYEVYRKVEGGSYKRIASLSASATKYSDKSVVAGKTYFYKVRPYTTNNNGIRTYSAFTKAIEKRIPYDYTLRSGAYTIVNKAELIPMKTGDTELDKLVSTIISEVTTSGMSKTQKLKAVYDYLINNITFGYPAYYNYDSRYISNVDRMVAGNAKYTLTNNVGTCLGFNASFVVLARRLGFEAIIQEGYSVSSTAYQHYWTNIKINGKWYLFDPQVEQTCMLNNSYRISGYWLFATDLYEPSKITPGYGSHYEYTDISEYRNAFNNFGRY